MGALSKSEIKTLAVTSAIAAAGGAVATAFVSYLLDKYVLKVEEQGPTFVVVPVVNYPVPDLPTPSPEREPQPVAGFGLSPETANKALSVKPPCYSRKFDRCLEDGNRYAPECVQYEPFHRAYEEDEDGYFEMIDAIRPCDYTTTQMWTNAAVASGVGAVTGIALCLIAGV